MDLSATEGRRESPKWSRWAGEEERTTRDPTGNGDRRGSLGTLSGGEAKRVFVTWPLEAKLLYL